MIWPFTCRCAKRRAWTEAGTADSPFCNMEEIAHKRDDWTTLRRCGRCGQTWQVDENDRYSRGFAIKIDGLSPEQWLATPDIDLRRQAMFENHGGLGAEECRWQGCRHRALKDSAFCTDCLYQHMQIRT